MKPSKQYIVGQDWIDHLIKCGGFVGHDAIEIADCDKKSRAVMIAKLQAAEKLKNVLKTCWATRGVESIQDAVEEYEKAGAADAG